MKSLIKPSFALFMIMFANYQGYPVIKDTLSNYQKIMCLFPMKIPSFGYELRGNQ